MKLSVKLLKQLVRESVEEMDQQDHGQMDQHGHGRDQDGKVRLFEPYENVKGIKDQEEGEDSRRLSESLKLVIREAIEENTVDECGISEEEALDEFISEGKPKLKKKKPVEAKKDKPAKKMNSGFAAFIKKAKEKAKK